MATSAPSGRLTVPANVSSDSCLHNIPCKTTYCGPARVSTYFLPAESDDGTHEASFRGRALRGKRIELPEGFSGLMLRSKAGACPDPKEGENLEAVGCFKEFTYWNHDTPPKDSDDIPQLMEWLAVSSVLHGTKPSQ